MKPILSYVALFVFLVCSLSAQKNLPALKEGELFNNGKHIIEPRCIVYSDDKGYLLEGIADGDLAFERINNDLSAGQTTIIDNKTPAGEVLRYSGSQVLNKTIYIFWILEKSKTNKFTLYCQQADPLTGKEITPKTVLLISNTYSDAFVAPKMIESDYSYYFRSAISNDHKKLLVVFPNDSTGKSENESYSINVYDSLLHPLKQSKYTFNIKHGQYLLKDIQVNNEGDVAFTGIETVDGRSVQMYSGTFPYIRPVGMFHLTLLKNKDNAVLDRTIKLDKKLVPDVAFNMGNHSLQIMGFWSDVVDYSNKVSMDIDRWYCKGSFFQNYDYTTNDPSINTMSTFPEQLIEDCDIWVAPRESDVQRRKREVFCLTAQQILTMPGGDFVLLSEQLTEYTPTAIYSGNIVVSRYSSAGNFKSTTNIPRFEIISEPTPSYIYSQDYVNYSVGESIYIIYSKGVQGLAYRVATKHNEAAMQKNIPESSIVFAEIGAEGQSTSSVLKDVEGESFFKLIQSCSYVDEKKSTVFLSGTDFKNYWFLSAKY